MNAAGRPRNAAKDEWADRYGLSRNQRKLLTMRFIDQLKACENEGARRILLGISGRNAA